MRIAPFIVMSLAAGAAHAQSPEVTEERAAWAVAAGYTGEVWAVDATESETRYLDNLDLTLDVDGETVMGVRGLQLFGSALYNNGHAVNEALAETMQGVSNIEATRAWRIYEAWAQWSSSSNTSVRAGLYDLNSEFDAIEAAGLFINPSHGIGADYAQSGENGPSIFPSTSVAVRLQVEAGRWQARVAVLDAIPGDPDRPDHTTVRWNTEEGLLYAGEIDYALPTGARTGVGVWHYSEPFDDVVRVDADGVPVARANNRGAYLFAETGALALSATRGELRAFTRTGWATAHVNPVERYLGAGVVWSGFLHERDDHIGVAIAHARSGDPWRRAMTNEGIDARAAETILELTGQFALGRFVTLQPDVQYVRHPGAVARGSVWCFGLRFTLAWSYEH